MQSHDHTQVKLDVRGYSLHWEGEWNIEVAVHNLVNIMLSDGRLYKRHILYDSVMWNTRNRQIHKNKSRLVIVRGQEEEGLGSEY